MTKQQTKKEKLDDLFSRARKSLSDSKFINWLSYCYVIFESSLRFNRRISRYDVTLIAMELERLRNCE